MKLTKKNKKGIDKNWNFKNREDMYDFLFSTLKESDTQIKVDDLIRVQDEKGTEKALIPLNLQGTAYLEFSEDGIFLHSEEYIEGLPIKRDQKELATLIKGASNLMSTDLSMQNFLMNEVWTLESIVENNEVSQESLRLYISDFIEDGLSRNLYLAPQEDWDKIIDEEISAIKNEIVLDFGTRYLEKDNSIRTVIEAKTDEEKKILRQKNKYIEELENLKNNHSKIDDFIYNKIENDFAKDIYASGDPREDIISKTQELRERADSLGLTFSQTECIEEANYKTDNARNAFLQATKTTKEKISTVDKIIDVGRQIEDENDRKIIFDNAKILLTSRIKGWKEKFHEVKDKISEKMEKHGKQALALFIASAGAIGIARASEIPEPPKPPVQEIHYDFDVTASPKTLSLKDYTKKTNLNRDNVVVLKEANEENALIHTDGTEQEVLASYSNEEVKVEDKEKENEIKTEQIVKEDGTIDYITPDGNTVATVSPDGVLEIGDQKYDASNVNMEEYEFVVIDDGTNASGDTSTSGSTTGEDIKTEDPEKDLSDSTKTPGDADISIEDYISSGGSDTSGDTDTSGGGTKDEEELEQVLGNGTTVSGDTSTSDGTDTSGGDVKTEDKDEDQERDLSDTTITSGDAEISIDTSTSSGGTKDENEGLEEDRGSGDTNIVLSDEIKTAVDVEAENNAKSADELREIKLEEIKNLDMKELPYKEL